MPTQRHARQCPLRQQRLCAWREETCGWCAPNLPVLFPPQSSSLTVRRLSRRPSQCPPPPDSKPPPPPTCQWLRPGTLSHPLVPLPCGSLLVRSRDVECLGRKPFVAAPPTLSAGHWTTGQPADVSLTGSLTNQGPGAARASKPPRGASCVLPPCDAPARALPFSAHNVPPPAHPHVPFPS